jgi:WD40 repeat protein
MDNIRQAAALEVPDRDPTALRELAIECIGTSYPCLRLQDTCAGHQGMVEHLAISPDGRWIASGGADGTARLWHITVSSHRGNRKIQGTPAAVLGGHVGGVTGVAFHPQGKWLATSARDGTVRLWQFAALAAETDQPAQRFELQAGPVAALDFSADGGWLAAGGKDGTVRLLALDPASGAETAERQTLSFHAGAITCLAFSPDGRLAVGTAGKSVRIWDVAAGKEVEYWATGNPPNALAFSPTLSPSMLASSEPEGYGVTAYTIDFNARKNQPQIHTNAVRALAYDRQGRLLTASADGSFKLWNQSHSAILGEVAVARGSWGEVRAVAASRSADWIATGYQDGRIRLWELTTPPERRLIGGEVQRAVFLGDQRRLATERRIYDFNRGCDCESSDFLPELTCCIATHPDGRRIAFAGERGALAIADLQREKPPVSCPGHRRGVTGLASSPDGELLASASLDGTIRVWDWDSGECRQTLEPGIGALHALAWTAESKQLMVDGEWGIAVCDLDKPGACRLIREHALRLSGMALFKGLLACCGPDHTVLLVDLATGKTVHTLEGHTAEINSIAFSGDGRLVAANATDGAVRVWQTPSGQGWGLFHHHDNLGTTLSFDPRGRYLAVNGRTTFVWISKINRRSQQYTTRSRAASASMAALCCWDRSEASDSVPWKNWNRRGPQPRASQNPPPRHSPPSTPK